jgi:hypothetical protein
MKFSCCQADKFVLLRLREFSRNFLCRFQIAGSIRKYHVTTKRTKDTKDSEIITFQFLNFVLFATFVVKCRVRFWLRLCRAVNSVPLW